jgi:hypothetical protein
MIKLFGNILITMLLILPLAANSQMITRQKNIAKSYAISKTCLVQVTNKYGNIQIVPWEKDSASFSIEIKASDKKETDADLMLASIDVEFTNTPYYLIAKTIFKNSKNQVLTDLSDYANSLFNLGKDVEINYIIYIPQTSALKIDNKYGNIYTTNHSASVEFILSNGDFKANDLTGSNTKIEISFGNAVVNTITNGKLSIGYSDFEIKNATKLSVESKSAKLSITSVESLDIISKRDKYYIDTIGSISGQSDFSYINVYYLQDSFFMKALYGDINMTDVSDSLKFMNITSDCTDISILFRKSASIGLDVSCKKTELTYPAIISGVQKTITNEKAGEYKATGTIGEGKQTTASLVQISAISGSIALNIK